MHTGLEVIGTEAALGGEPSTSTAQVLVSVEENRRDRPLKSPALFVALAFALGIASSGRSHESASALFQFIPALLALSGICLLFGTILVRTGREIPAAIVVLAGFVLAGASAASLFRFRFPPTHISNLASWGIDLNRPLNLEGVLLSDPIRGPSGIEFDLEALELDQAPDSGTAIMRVVTGRVRVIATYSAADPDGVLGL